MSSLDERSHTFVVRIWEERRDVADAVPTWRGRVDDVRTGVRRYFTTLEDLVAYLSRESGMAGRGQEPIPLSPSLRRTH
ncbi:MAG: hypothetical protein JO352_28875 [Chloroflexi bacterium]|nr:hypothetical protein [Chloroflexota bacterium]MBV9602521.1 hypothetical protein [Chloroflexota bacterium]